MKPCVIVVSGEGAERVPRPAHPPEDAQHRGGGRQHTQEERETAAQLTQQTGQ